MPQKNSIFFRDADLSRFNFVINLQKCVFLHIHISIVPFIYNGKESLGYFLPQCIHSVKAWTLEFGIGDNTKYGINGLC